MDLVARHVRVPFLMGFLSSTCEAGGWEGMHLAVGTT